MEELQLSLGEKSGAGHRFTLFASANDAEIQTGENPMMTMERTQEMQRCAAKQ
jgi:hypothetical protein